MKVGIDGVLLGSWAGVDNVRSILDIGTGTGLIALMLAQRSNAKITVIDVNKNAILQAVENVEKSPWNNRITVLENSIQEFSLQATLRYDLIVSNPPYFVNSLKTPDESRTTARHTDTLTHEDLIVCAMKLLSSDGKICLILPVEEGLKCSEFAESKGLFCTQKVTVFPKPEANPKRLLLEFGWQKVHCVETELIIEADVRHQYSPEFSALAKDFYLML